MVGTAVRIGISGPSCSGKSTLAGVLARRLGATRLCLDDFYLRGHVHRYVEVDGRPVRSFEHPGAYDGGALLDAAARAVGPVVAEGFLLHAYPGLREAFDLAFHVDLPWGEIRRRRAARSGQCSPGAETSFDLLGEAEWEAFGAGQAGLPGIVALDGLRPPGELADIVLSSLARRAA